MFTRRQFLQLSAAAGLLAAPSVLSPGRRIAVDDLTHRVLKLLPEIQEHWKNDPNIQGIGFGLRVSGYELTEEPVIKFFVKHKFASDRAIVAIGSQKISPVIEGVPTDVEEIAFVAATGATGPRDNRFRPLVGGVSIGNADNHVAFWDGWGTLGTLCFDEATGDPMVLSNWHVLGSDGDVGDIIIQPSHPRPGDYVEAFAKLATCGTEAFLLEWQVPSGLTIALAGAAAELAIAAALSDAIDPFRVGQQETAPGPGELTMDQRLSVNLEFLDMPLPGTPFNIDADWRYERTTQSSVRTHQQIDHRRNDHVLLGKRVSTDRLSYQQGDVIRIHATLYTSAPRSCDSFHVVSFLVPEADQSKRIQVVLNPVRGPVPLPLIPDPDTRCVEFSGFNKGQSLPNQSVINGVTFNAPGKESNRIVSFGGTSGELLLSNNVMARFPPSVRVQATILTFKKSGSVRMQAFGPAGLVDQTASTIVGSAETLEVSGAFINQIVFLDGDSESSLLRLCSVEIPDGCSERVESCRSSFHIGFACCYEGSITVRPEVSNGRWNIHLVSQTVNTVPSGVPADVAAQTIGGLSASQSLSLVIPPSLGPASAVGCIATMFLDHVFDVI